MDARELVSNIINDKAVDAMESMNQLLAAKIAERLEVKKAEIAQSLYAEEAEQVDEVSQKLATNVYARRSDNEWEADDYGNEDDPSLYKNGKPKSEISQNYIEKKFGPKAMQHAYRAAHRQTFGRDPQILPMPDKPEPYKKKKVAEEAEQVDEVLDTQPRILAYGAKAFVKGMKAALVDKDFDTAKKREKGLRMVMKKVAKKHPEVMEEAEQIDEISKGLAKSYSDKVKNPKYNESPNDYKHNAENSARWGRVGQDSSLSGLALTQDDADRITKYNMRKSTNRKVGLDRAAARVAEETEQIDELSYDLAKRAADQAFIRSNKINFAAEVGDIPADKVSKNAEKMNDERGKKFEKYAQNRLETERVAAAKKLISPAMKRKAAVSESEQIDGVSKYAEQIDEISQKLATKAYAEREKAWLANDYGTNDDYGKTKSGKFKADLTYDRITKKFGPKAAQNALRAGHAAAHGRDDPYMPKKVSEEADQINEVRVDPSKIDQKDWWDPTDMREPKKQKEVFMSALNSVMTHKHLQNDAWARKMIAKYKPHVMKTQKGTEE